MKTLPYKCCICDEPTDKWDSGFTHCMEVNCVKEVNFKIEQDNEEWNRRQEFEKSMIDEWGEDWDECR